jgi:hypothetical protein
VVCEPLPPKEALPEAPADPVVVSVVPLPPVPPPVVLPELPLPGPAGPLVPAPAELPAAAVVAVVPPAEPPLAPPAELFAAGGFWADTRKRKEP